MQTSLEQAPSNLPLRFSQGPKLNHIMLIAGEAELAENLQIELNRQGYQVSIIHDGLRGILAIRRIVPDLVIISWSPPRLSGLEICTRLKASRSDVPIILLTQGCNAGERIAGLQAGASDCVSPPFVKEEFFARIQANLVHPGAGQTQASILHCADLRLNRNTREVFRGDHFVQLTAKEFDLLEYMMNHYFQVLTREQILENVWGYSFMGSSNIIEVYIRYLRQKLEAPQATRLIHTVRGVGYILRETV